MAARRDALPVLLRIAFRNLTASPVRTAILGAIVLAGSLIVVVGWSMPGPRGRGWGAPRRGVRRAGRRVALGADGGLREGEGGPREGAEREAGRADGDRPGHGR